MSYTPRYTNLVSMLEQSVRRFGHKPLFGTRTPQGWEWCTYASFDQMTEQMCSGLATLGVQSGDRVAVISNNCLEWAVGAYGSYRLGAAYTPMYEAQAADEWAYILRDSGAKVCFVATTAIRDKLQQLRDQVPELQHLVCFTDDSYRNLLDEGRKTPISPAPPTDEQLAALVYTSGTTGKPKGVMLTHRNLAATVSACLLSAPFAGEERSLAFLPWAHVFGGSVELNSIIAYGGSMGICGDTSQLLSYLPEVQPTLLFAVPRIWNRVYDGVHKQIATKPKPIQALFRRGLAAKTKERQGIQLGRRERVIVKLAERLVFKKIVDRFGGRLRFAFSGAAALSADVARFIDCLGIAVYEGYGLTETTAGTTANLERRFGSVGKPMPGVTIQIDEQVEGKHPGEGEIIVYGDGVMKGYFNREEETRAQFTADGGLRTGDLGRLDADGYLYVTGRVKELFKLENGKYIAPAPLEETLQLSPYIAQCMVHGADHPYLVALIVPDMISLREWAQKEKLGGDDATLLSDAKTRRLLQGEIERLSERFKGYERVRDFVLEPQEMSTDNGMLTPSLKVKRRVVAERHGKRLEALYA